MKLNALSLTAILALSSGASAHAQILNFDFTMISNDTYAPPAITGTITGEVIGLENGALSYPSDIIITSAPAALGITIPPGGFSIANNGGSFGTFPSNPPAGGGIDVVGGEVTSDVNFTASWDGYMLYFNVNPPAGDGFNGLSTPSNTYGFSNQGGFSGVTFTAAVPEPSTWALLLGGLGFLAFWNSRARHARL